MLIFAVVLPGNSIKHSFFEKGKTFVSGFRCKFFYNSFKTLVRAYFKNIFTRKLKRIIPQLFYDFLRETSVMMFCHNSSLFTCVYVICNRIVPQIQF